MSFIFFDACEVFSEPGSDYSEERERRKMFRERADAVGCYSPRLTCILRFS